MKANPIKTFNSQWLAGRATGTSGRVVLIVEDSEADIFFLLRAFSASNLKNPVFVVRSGQEAIAYLEGQGIYANRAQYPIPSIVFLDLKMPDINGYDVLRWKQSQNSLPKILWVVVSNFDGPKTINAAYEAGASTFLSKPLNSADLENLIQAFEDYWLQSTPPTPPIPA